MADTLSGWTITTITLVLEKLPLQTYDSAKLLVDNYLTSVGGWTPDVIADPTGFGQPADGSTTTAAAGIIVNNQLAKMHHISATVNVDLTMDILANLPSGQTDSAILSQITSVVKNTINTQLANTTMSLDSVNTVNGSVTPDGTITAAQRADIETAITTNSYQSDPRAIGVVNARRIYSLDDTWSIQSYYTETSTEISIIIQKYEDKTFSKIDTAVSKIYIISIQSDGFTVIGGTVLAT